MTAVLRPTLPFPVTAATALLGEVITWTCPGLAVRYADLVAALD